MKKLSLILASAAAIAFAAPVIAADETYESNTKIQKDDKGNYSEKDKTVQSGASGKVTDEKNVKVDVDSKGNTDKTVETAKTHKTGWFHSNTTKTKDTEKTKDDGSVETSHKVTVDGTTTQNDSHVSAPAH